MEPRILQNALGGRLVCLLDAKCGKYYAGLAQFIVFLTGMKPCEFKDFFAGDLDLFQTSENGFIKLEDPKSIPVGERFVDGRGMLQVSQKMAHVGRVMMETKEHDRPPATIDDFIREEIEINMRFAYAHKNAANMSGVTSRINPRYKDACNTAWLLVKSGKEALDHWVNPMNVPLAAFLMEQRRFLERPRRKKRSKRKTGTLRSSLNPGAPSFLPTYSPDIGYESDSLIVYM